MRLRIIRIQLEGFLVMFCRVVQPTDVFQHVAEVAMDRCCIRLCFNDRGETRNRIIVPAKLPQDVSHGNLNLDGVRIGIDGNEDVAQGFATFSIWR